jgi:hypothetical protein
MGLSRASDICLTAPYGPLVEIDGRTFFVRAIVEDDVDPTVVVTMYRTSKISKYRGRA